MSKDTFEEHQEITALRDEVRYLRQSRKKAVERAKFAVERANLIERPIIEVRDDEREGYERVYVNGVFIEGWEIEGETGHAGTFASRLRKAFSMTPTASEKTSSK